MQICLDIVLLHQVFRNLIQGHLVKLSSMESKRCAEPNIGSNIYLCPFLNCFPAVQGCGGQSVCLLFKV
eukprot:13795760-Ditylum_brightwellii.AAC.1